jgi:hypothetical protein
MPPRLYLALALGLAPAAAFARDAGPLVPVPLPDPHLGGFHFPESEATLTRWITESSRAETPEARTAAADRIALHGWGLWTALTAPTTQSSERQPLRVFETWFTPEELVAESSGAAARALSLFTPPRVRSRGVLRPLVLLRPPIDATPVIDAAPAETTATEPAVNRIVGFVKFDPTAADHIRRQGLLQRATLDTLLAGGAQQVTPFPATALAVKSVFQIVHIRELVDGRYYFLKAWSGPPAYPQPWSPADWPGGVWIDVGDDGAGDGAIDETPAADGSTRTDATTYPLSALINYRLSAADAAALNQAKPGANAAAGDYAILVAMHVAGREIARWTWQTFWWTPAPDDPPAPSSAAIARQRPPQLDAAARHYAMAIGYAMLSPDQPYVGGGNDTPAVYAYNPWIEARLGPAELPDSQRGFDPAGQPADNNTGIQTNCMSCHIQATYNPHHLSTAPRFTGARYVDLGAAAFVGTLQTEFLWSIARQAQ